MNERPMSDRALADALRAAYAAYHDHFPTDEEQEVMIGLENEVCERLAIPLDETEQGLTENALTTIRLFIDHCSPA